MKRFNLCLLLFVFSLSAFCQRTINTINDAWRFCIGDNSEAMQPYFNDNSWQTVNLPHCWNAEDAAKNHTYYRGICWYRKRLSNPVQYGKKYFLHFEGAFQLTDVYVNGEKAGEHAGGYTAFTFDITKLLNYDKDSVNVISVKVDNSFNKDIAPLSGDFTFWGGIYRDVYLVELKPLHFNMDDHGSNGIFIETPSVSDSESTVKIRSYIKNESAEGRNVKVLSVITDADGNTIQEISAKVKLSAGVVKCVDLTSDKIQSPRLWTPDDPYLYHISTRIVDTKNGQVIDEIVNPLGFRWFSVDTQNGFMLNGEPIKLIGAARHQDYPGLGSALNNDLNYRDVKLLKDMGANYLRISHYPQDPSILDACDKLGIIAWEEIPIVNRITIGKTFRDNCTNNLLEMIRQNYNHPSIFIWAYSNEVMLGKEKDDEVNGYDSILVKFLKDFEAIVRKEDPYRITSMAFHAGEIYNNSGVGDIPMTVGWNRYDGWYSPRFQDFPNALDDQNRRYPKRPMFISEYGAGSDARIHSISPMRYDFSIEYQQIYHETTLPEIMKRRFVVGSSIWNFVDFGSALRQESMHNVNNKGILYQNRNPKDVCYYYQAMLSKSPMAHIASHDWMLRAGTPANQTDNFAYQSVKVYTNQSEVELFHNHKSLGKQSANNCFTVFQVPFVEGQNILEAKTVAPDGEVIYDDLTINFEMNPYLLSDYKKNDLRIAVNAGSNCFYTDEQTRIIYQPDQPYRKGSWGYAGGNMFMSGDKPGTQQDIKATVNIPLFQTSREGMSAYQFDVPDGTYTVELYFCEPVSPAKSSIYILGSKDTESQAKRIFNVSLNGCQVLSHFNISDCGALTAVIKTYTVVSTGEKGINLSFEPVTGKPIISGIKVTRDY